MLDQVYLESVEQAADCGHRIVKKFVKTNVGTAEGLAALSVAWKLSSERVWIAVDSSEEFLCGGGGGGGGGVTELEGTNRSTVQT